MLVAKGVLVDHERVVSASNLLICVLVSVFLIFLYDIFILKVDIEQDLVFVIFEEISIDPSRLENLKSIFKRILERITVLVGRSRVSCSFLNLRSIRNCAMSVRVCNEESVYIELLIEKGNESMIRSSFPLIFFQKVLDRALVS